MSSTPPIPDHLPYEDQTPQQAPRFSREHWLLFMGLVLIGMNLRPALSSLAPVLQEVIQGRQLSASLAGLLTTLPVACLGLFGPLAPHLARRWGSEKTIAVALLTLASGIVLRSVLGQAGLFAGSLLAGASIGVIGVLLPGIVKRDFAHQVSLMTGVYTMALCLGAALAAGLTVPAKQLFGQQWQAALAIWALPALMAFVLWWPQLRRSLAMSGQRWQVQGLLRDKLAWQVTMFMGLQSSIAYIVFGWLPPILIERGLTPLAAGWMVSASIMIQVASALLVPTFARFSRDQRAPIVLTLALTLGGFLGLLFAPLSQLLFWAVVLGLGQGGLFSVALSLLALRSPDPHVAAHLSGMAQGIGYMLASLGPLSVGMIRDVSHSPWPLAALLSGITALALSFGWQAGQRRLVKVVAYPCD